MNDDDTLVDRWIHRQELLRTRLEALRAANLSFRADLELGRFWWQGSDGHPVVVATTRFLLSYAHSDHSILCGWENSRMPPHTTVPAVSGIEARVRNSNEQEAWMIAFRVADAVGAHYVYRAPNPQSTAFLGLWDVRPAAAGDAPFVDVPPWAHVRTVLAALIGALDEGRELSALARGYGRSFAEDERRRGTPFEAPLRSLGQRLQRIAGLSAVAQRATLEAFDAEVARYEKS